MACTGMATPGEYASARSRWVASGFVGVISSLPGLPPAWNCRASCAVKRAARNCVAICVSNRCEGCRRTAARGRAVHGPMRSPAGTTLGCGAARTTYAKGKAFVVSRLAGSGIFTLLVPQVGVVHRRNRDTPDTRHGQKNAPEDRRRRRALDRCGRPRRGAAERALWPSRRRRRWRSISKSRPPIPTACCGIAWAISTSCFSRMRLPPRRRSASC